ncbi:hypothetical protein PoB_007075600 [Plakobranchus ocellatus]|uniref:Uncharacterized protein n=1 Tax=Plakobranchus ocellatus TaxID=259542 RepID=A0AAV4DK44_9GAST|nr:hypothetical protein PoB_007075600 [Plakobranchus ocellatus]
MIVCLATKELVCYLLNENPESPEGLACLLHSLISILARKSGDQCGKWKCHGQIILPRPAKSEEEIGQLNVRHRVPTIAGRPQAFWAPSNRALMLSSNLRQRRAGGVKVSLLPSTPDTFCTQMDPVVRVADRLQRLTRKQGRQSEDSD